MAEYVHKDAASDAHAKRLARAIETSHKLMQAAQDYSAAVNAAHGDDGSDMCRLAYLPLLEAIHDVTEIGEVWEAYKEACRDEGLDLDGLPEGCVERSWSDADKFRMFGSYR